jgi:hypothetical protein
VCVTFGTTVGERRRRVSQNAAANGPKGAETEEFDVVVVGGGVAGLYCAWKLSEESPDRKDRKVGLFEATGRWGGRIETKMFGPFPAEFGPMRYEDPVQERLMVLLGNLDLGTEEFEPYQAERPDFPVYDLTDSEKGPPPFENRHDTLELLKLGIIRVLQNTKEDERWRSRGNRNNPRDEKHKEWLRGLTEDDYQSMRERAKQGGEYLRDLGLWNALSEVLSHQALMKIRDLGTFYHLIPENPNAIEWIIFWLRAFNPDADLVKVTGGSGKIAERLELELRRRPDRVSLHSEHTLTGLKTEPGGKVLLAFARNGGDPEGEDRVQKVYKRARRVVLALPKGPLEKLAGCFRKQTREDLDEVFGFPLLKCFFLVNDPWWDNDTKPHSRASLMPTREVHYFFDERAKQGLVMLYTDRPATEFWKHYVTKEPHVEAEIRDEGEAEITGEEPLPKLFFKYLARELKQEAERHPDETLEPDADGAGSPEGAIDAAASSTSPAEQDGHMIIGADEELKPEKKKVLKDARNIEPEEHAGKIVEERVVKYGIRDWSREPYDAACHVWRPGAKSWEVLGRLKAFSLPDDDHENVHICGEAYSDYHGFIEGALRSADVVLNTIEEPEMSSGPQGGFSTGAL